MFGFLLSKLRPPSDHTHLMTLGWLLPAVASCCQLLGQPDEPGRAVRSGGTRARTRRLAALGGKSTMKLPANVQAVMRVVCDRRRLLGPERYYKSGFGGKAGYRLTLVRHHGNRCSQLTRSGPKVSRLIFISTCRRSGS